VKVLKSDEGRTLRARHQENVRYLRAKLLKAGLPVIHTPSHIIPIHVGNRAHLVFITSAEVVFCVFVCLRVKMAKMNGIDNILNEQCLYP